MSIVGNGSSVLVFDANGAPIACQRNVDVTFNDDLIDVTCKQDNGFSTFLPGKRSFSMTCEALTDWGQNLLLWSEEFGNAVWVDLNVVITSDFATAPNGTLTADEILDDATNGQHYILQQYITSDNGNYTFSAFIKNSGIDFIRFGMTDGISDAYVDINLTNNTTANLTTDGAWSNGSVSILNDTNGFVRISFTATKGAGTSIFPIIYLCDSLGSTSYSGTGTNGIIIWGAQLNTGTTAQSYYQTTSTVNPNIDTLVSANLNRTKVELNIANPAFDDIYFNGEAYVESIELNAGTETEASYTVTFSGTGDLVSLVS